jgi:hypothetical protein
LLAIAPPLGMLANVVAGCAATEGVLGFAAKRFRYIYGCCRRLQGCAQEPVLAPRAIDSACLPVGIFDLLRKASSGLTLTHWEIAILPRWEVRYLWRTCPPHYLHQSGVCRGASAALKCANVRISAGDASQPDEGINTRICPRIFARGSCSIAQGIEN